MNDETKLQSAEQSAIEPEPGRRNIILETMLVAIVVSVVSTVLQKLVFGDSSIAVSVVLTVLMEVIYFKFLARRTAPATSRARPENPDAD